MSKERPETILEVLAYHGGEEFTGVIPRPGAVQADEERKTAYVMGSLAFERGQKWRPQEYFHRMELQQCWSDGWFDAANRMFPAHPVRMVAPKIGG